MATKSFAKLTHHSVWHDIANEFRKKYNKSLLVLDGNPIFVKNVCMDSGVQKEDYIIYEDLEGNEKTLRANTDQLLEVKWPEFGFFTYNGRLCKVSRVPKRQYVWGIVPENLYIFDFLSTFIDKDNNLLCLKTYSYAIAPIHVKLSLEILNTPIVGFSLTKNLGVTIHPTINNSHMIWYDCIPIAKITDNNIYITAQWFKQELIDYLRDFRVKEFVIHD